MAAWQKTNEAWFGDTFDRDATLCSYTVDGVKLNSTDKAMACNAYIPMDAITYASGSTSHAESACTATMGITMQSHIDTLEAKFEPITESLKQLQAQIDALKKRLMVNTELRSALKTLHYKREVE